MHELGRGSQFSLVQIWAVSLSGRQWQAGNCNWKPQVFAGSVLVWELMVALSLTTERFEKLRGVRQAESERFNGGAEYPGKLK